MQVQNEGEEKYNSSSFSYHWGGGSALSSSGGSLCLIMIYSMNHSWTMKRITFLQADKLKSSNFPAFTNLGPLPACPVSPPSPPLVMWNSNMTTILMEGYLEPDWASCHLDLLDRLNLFFCKQVTLFITVMTTLWGSECLLSSGNMSLLPPQNIKGTDWAQR